MVLISIEPMDLADARGSQIFEFLPFTLSFVIEIQHIYMRIRTGSLFLGGVVVYRPGLYLSKSYPSLITSSANLHSYVCCF